MFGFLSPFDHGVIVLLCGVRRRITHFDGQLYQPEHVADVISELAFRRRPLSRRNNQRDVGVGEFPGKPADNPGSQAIRS